MYEEKIREEMLANDRRMDEFRVTVGPRVILAVCGSDFDAVFFFNLKANRNANLKK